MPYTVKEEAMTAGANVAYNGYAHSFAGMAIQFLLFAMANIGIEMLLERQRGLWRRLRSAPVSKVTLLARQGGERRAHLADDSAGVVRLRDGRVQASASTAACSVSSASRSPAR